MPDMPDDPVSPRPDHLFKPGMTPHNKGRTGTHRNARSKLASLVFQDAMAHWDDHGPGALRRLAFHDPAAYVQFIAKLVPQRIEHEVATPFDDVDESLLALSLRLSKAIAFLPDEDRELLDMLLTKGELLASQKNLERHNAEEGVGAKVDGNFSGGKGTPHPQITVSPTPQNAGSENRGDAVGESASILPASENVIDADFDEEDDSP